MSEHTNRRRFLGTIERHREDWLYENSRLVIDRSMSFRNRKFSDITLELFPRSFFVVHWTRGDGIDRWCYSYYSGKMYRTLDTMVRVLIGGRPRAARRVRGDDSTVVAATGNIPMELAFDNSTLEYTLIATLTRGEGSPGAFCRNWMAFLSIPDAVLDRIDSRVSNTEARLSDPTNSRPEFFETNNQVDLGLQKTQTLEGVEDEFLPITSGPVRVIRI